MNKTVMAAAALAIVGACAFAVAQTAPPPPATGAPAVMPPAGTAGMRASAEDRAVLLDARIGAIKAALKLTADQEKLWEPVEAFIRKRAAQRDQRMQEMREKLADMRDGAPRPAFDPIALARANADRLTMRAAMLREFADAASPLYASLTDDQKRRAFLLMTRLRGGMGEMRHPMGQGGMGPGGMGRGGMGDDGMMGPGMGRGRMRWPG